MSANDCSTALRKYVGPEAAEIALLCRPQGRADDVVAQSEAAYRALAEQMAAERSSFRDLTSETLFLRDIRRDLPGVLEARARVLADLGETGSAPLPAFIEQAPLDASAAFELAAAAVVPCDRDSWSMQDVPPDASCACEGCARSGARLVHLGDQVSLHTANLYGEGSDAYQQAWAMFRAAERMLARCGMGFRDVVRTWIQLRDIDRDYDALNRARREFFLQNGIEPRPASTGVQGIPLPERHGCTLSLHAVKAPRPLDVAPMSTPFLNEAWSYGADFSRGLKVVDANKTTLHVSGTASIDEAGRTAHPGDFDTQAERMLDNIESLLRGQGATFASLMSGATYLRRPSDAPALRTLYRRRGFEGFPCVLVAAPLCRPELLCETEVVAHLPRRAAGA